jgi:hypothetical protein
MISFVVILKSKSSLIILAAALINAVSAERMRQFERTRELGTLAYKIENCRMLGQDSSALQRQYNRLAK